MKTYIVNAATFLHKKQKALMIVDFFGKGEDGFVFKGDSKIWHDDHVFVETKLEPSETDISDAEFQELIEQGKNPAAVALGKKSAKAREGKTDYSALARKRWDKKA